MNFKPIMNLVIIVEAGKTSLTGRLADYDDTHIQIIGRNGIPVFIKISEITYISPLKNQPKVVI